MRTGSTVGIGRMFTVAEFLQLGLVFLAVFLSVYVLWDNIKQVRGPSMVNSGSQASGCFKSSPMFCADETRLPQVCHKY